MGLDPREGEAVSEPAAPTLSELLRTFRTRAGLTQAALAELAGLSEQAISVLERGTRSRPRVDTVRSLIAALGLDGADADQFVAVARGKSHAGRPTPPPAPAADALPVPWQLPPALPDFTGRTAQIEAMLSMLRVPPGAEPQTVGVVAITGMGGIGKTALAVQAAHKLTDSYPDGHLYLNLRGYGPGLPVSTLEALRQLLRSLGLDSRLVPDEVEAAAALLRSQLAGRRMLILLDNATDVAQVTPLLPGSPGSAAVITSRGPIAALPGARQIRLDALSENESVELLSGVVGQTRVQAEPGAAATLASFTGRLPLAVRLIGGRLATRPNWPIQHLVDLLRDEERRLDSLGSDETGVRASIASSVRFLASSDRELDRQAANALPMLSVPDGSDLRTIVAAHLLDVPVRRADAILERLVDLNLLESTAPERYRFHDLIRAFARELAEETLSERERDEALARVLRLYITAAWACHTLTHPTSPRLKTATVHSKPMPSFPDAAAALQWLDAEHRNLVDRVAQLSGTPVARTGLFPELALAMFGYYEPRRRWVEMRELGRGTVALAEELGLSSAAAWLQHDAAIPEVENGDLESAVPLLATALKMFEAQNDLSGQSRCCSSLTYVLSHLGRVDEALEFGNRSLLLGQELGDKTLEGVAYIAVGSLYNQTGDHRRADEAFGHGIQLGKESGDPRSLFKRYINTGFSHLVVHRIDDAIAQVQHGLEVAAASQNEVGQEEAHQTLILAFGSCGDFDRARQHGERALELSRKLLDGVREGRVLLELARINAATGHRSTAIDQARTSAAMLAGRAPIHAHLAEELAALLERGDPYTYAITTHSI
jgi:transcriptional regulator with XRE-family HTH domain/tetratricopeptide (TPR) repeat protein